MDEAQPVPSEFEIDVPLPFDSEDADLVEGPGGEFIDAPGESGVRPPITVEDDDAE